MKENFKKRVPVTKESSLIRYTSLLFILMAYMVMGSGCETHELVLDAGDFGLQEGIDNTPAIIAALEASKVQKATKLVFPPGRYDLYPEKAYEEFRNISNNDDGKKRIVFLLNDFSNFEIDGQGAAFICHDHMVPFALKGSENITIRNLSIDWATPFFFQGQVVALYPEKQAFDIKVLDECIYEIRGDELFFSNKEDYKPNSWLDMAPPDQQNMRWSQNINWNIWFDPVTRAPAYLSAPSRVFSWNLRENRRAVVEDMGNRIVRFSNAVHKLPEMGWVLISKGNMLSQKRLSPAIHIANSRNVLLNNVIVYHASGMGLIAERSENITLDAFNVLLPENSERLVSTTADATHFVNCRGVVRFENCTFENMLDDATNVHGIYSLITGAAGERTLGMVRGHSHQQGFEFAAAGDRIQLVDRYNLKPYAEVTVEAVNNRNDYYFEVTIDQPVEGILRPESVAENISWQADVVMRNCIVRNNRARSILISTAGDVLIENNHFKKCTYAGVLTAGDADFWFESGPFRNIIIRDNIFEDLGLAGGSAPVLGLLPHVDTDIDPEWYYHQNLVFERNTINTFSRNIVRAKSIRNLVFKDNIINQSKHYVSVAQDGDPVFVFEDCRDIQIEGNQYNWEKEASIRLLGRTSGVRAENNHNMESVNR